MNEAEHLFSQLEQALSEAVEAQYFQEPRDFRSLIQVIEILNAKLDQLHQSDQSDLQIALKQENKAHAHLTAQLAMVNRVIEEVVTFQHGGLNHSVDTLTEVVREYSRGRDDIRVLRASLSETQSVLTARQRGNKSSHLHNQVSLKELWSRKMELQESLRLVRDLEELKALPLKVQRLMAQKRFLSSVIALNSGVKKMFGEDLVGVGGLSAVREQIMDLKEVLLENCVLELREAILGPVAEIYGRDSLSVTDTEDLSENRSDAGMSVIDSQSQRLDDNRSVLSHQRGGKANMAGSVAGREVNPSAPNEWSIDLSEVDEGTETALIDPSTSGALFIRLLVKTVHVLRCEEDVERMVFESISRSFRDIRVARCKKLAMARLQMSLDQRGGFATEDEELNFHSRQLSDYCSALMDLLVGLMQRLLYVNRLLSHSLVKRGSSAVSMNRKSANKAILELWAQLEENVVREMRSHLVEEDLARISDAQALRRSFRGSSVGVDEDDEESRLLDDCRVIFKPSAHHAAALFKRAVVYSTKCWRLVKEYGLDETEEAVMGQETLRSKSKPGNAPTIMQLMNREREETNFSLPNRILDSLQCFLEEELLPVIQSLSNSEIRDMQLQSMCFRSPIPPVSTEAGWAAPCLAAERVLRTSEFLCRYWTQLFQHRPMVAVVLDRLVRGFASAAREAQEPVTYNWLCNEATLVKEEMKTLPRDACYLSYRQRVNHGRNSLDELFYGPSLTGELGSVGSSAGSSLIPVLGSVWSSTFWDISSANHPLQTRKISYDTEAIKLVASISYGCDWLIRKLASLCSVTRKRSMMHATAAFLASGQGLGTASTRGGNVSNSASSFSRPSGKRNPRQWMNESKQQLTSTFLDLLRDLTRLSDECLSMLRLELQVMAFYFVRKLSMALLTLDLTEPTKQSSVAPTSNQVEDEVAQSFVVQMTGFLSAAATALSPFALATVTGGVASLLPRLVMKMVTVQYRIGSRGNLLKSRLIRLIVSLQQQISTAIHSLLSGDGDARRKLLDGFTEELERVRKYVGMLEVPLLEAKGFLKKASVDYSMEEIKLIWLLSTNRTGESFEIFVQEMSQEDTWGNN